MKSDEVMDHHRITITPTNNIASSLREGIRGSEGRYRTYDDPLASSGTIHKVPSFLLEGNIDANSITPKLVSIGPYHHGKPHLREMEGVKLKYLGDLLNRSPSNSPEIYIHAVELLARRAKVEYSSLGELNHDNFVKMMVVDGCFIIEFLLKWYHHDMKTQVSSVMKKLTVFKNDLLLVENQIPYFVLQELFKATVQNTCDYRDEEKLLVLFSLKFFMGDLIGTVTARAPSLLVQTDHLLHLYHKSLKIFHVAHHTYRFEEMIHEISSKLALFFSYPFVLLYPLLAKLKTDVLFSLPCYTTIIRRPGNLTSLRMLSASYIQLRWDSPGIPNACNLREMGFTFHRKHTMDYFNIAISRHGRKIKIPVLHINDSMLTIFQNLIAFEHCSNKYGKDFTAYAVFLDCLVESAEDVAILKECGVIDNRLGDDQKVAVFFDNLCSGIYMGENKHYLSPLFNHVSNYYKESYYRVKFYWWRKKYVPGRDYFKNPWAIPSMIAAVILLALSVVQTFYTVYSYYHQR